MNTYEIGGKTFQVEELTVNQKRELAKLLKTTGIGSIVETGIDVGKILDAIGEQDQLARFYAIVCTEQGREWEASQLDENQQLMGKAKGTQEAGIIEDFLSVNASWWKRLNTSLAPLFDSEPVASNGQPVSAPPPRKPKTSTSSNGSSSSLPKAAPAKSSLYPK